MWKITIGEIIHYVEEPHWIRQFSKLGVTMVITASNEEEAQGLQVKGILYQIKGKPEMEGDFALAEVEWLEIEEGEFTEGANKDG